MSPRYDDYAPSDFARLEVRFIAFEEAMAANASRQMELIEKLSTVVADNKHTAMRLGVVETQLDKLQEALVATRILKWFAGIFGAAVVLTLAAKLGFAPGGK